MHTLLLTAIWPSNSPCKKNPSLTYLFVEKDLNIKIEDKKDKILKLKDDKYKRKYIEDKVKGKKNKR